MEKYLKYKRKYIVGGSSDDITHKFAFNDITLKEERTKVPEGQLGKK